MKTNFLSMLFAFISGATLAQESLYANDTHTVVLFFPGPIRQAVTGSEDFTFSYNKEVGQHFGLLQANRGSSSNLLVITQDGRAYSYNLEYQKELLETFRFVTTTESIGTETETEIPKPLPMVPPITKTAPKLDRENRQELIEKGAEYVLGKRTNVLKTKRRDGLVLRLKELFYRGNEVYMEVEIQNRSAIDFEVDVLEIYRVNGKKGRRSSHQKVLLEPRLKYDLPGIVRVGQSHRFVYVLPKFTLGDSDKLLLELHEQHGGRMLTMKWK